MKAKQLRDFLNTLSEKELNGKVIYNSPNLSISGIVQSVDLQKCNLYYDGGDDPSTLETKEQLKGKGYENDDIAEMDVEIRKGSIVITF